MTSYQAAMSDVRDRGALPVPLHMRNAVTGLMRSLGYGAGYEYAHDHDDNVAAEQTHLPDELVGRHYYEPGKTGAEPEIASGKRAVNERREAGLKAPAKRTKSDSAHSGDGPSRPEPPSPRPPQGE
jgi:putative ATPase